MAPELGHATGFLLPQQCARRAPAATVLQSLLSHHRPFLPFILNSEISVKVRARFADSLCRKHRGAGESKAFAAGRPFFGRRCSPLGDQLSFPKPQERFVSHLKLTAEIPQGSCFGGHGRRRSPDSPETSGCLSTGSCRCRGRSWGSLTEQGAREGTRGGRAMPKSAGPPCSPHIFYQGHSPQAEAGHPSITPWCSQVGDVCGYRSPPASSQSWR